MTDTSQTSAQRSITRSTFVLEREYRVEPARVFAAFADREQKAKWFGGPDEQPDLVWETDFREGGREFNSSTFEGQTHVFEAVYHDIVQDVRIVYSYVMRAGDVKLSASLTSIELEPTDTGTRLVMTEHGAYFDGHEEPKLREDGTGWLLDSLGRFLDS